MSRSLGPSRPLSHRIERALAAPSKPRRSVGLMRHLFLGSLSLGMCGTAMATVNLIPSVIGPNELQLNKHEEFTLRVQNTGATAASGVVARMVIGPHVNMATAYFPTYCGVVGNGALRAVQCSFGSVGRAGASNSIKSFKVVLQAPATAMNVQHSITATGAGTPSFASAGVTTAYANYTLYATAGNWASTACGGSVAPIAYDICPSGSIVAGTLPFNANGSIGTSSTAYWQQTGPQTLEMFTGTTTVYMEAINSKCFRGRSTLPYSSPYTTSTTWYTANKICKP